eukprot:8525810-Ditylum_brightwellii.AAC.1
MDNKSRYTFMGKQFVDTKEQWYTVDSIKDGQKQAIAGVKLITSYFNKRNTTSRAKILQRFTSHYNGIKCDAKQKQGVQTRGRACINFKDHRGVENT